MTTQPPILVKVTSKIQVVGGLYVRLAPVAPPQTYALVDDDGNATFIDQSATRAGQVVGVEDETLTFVTLYVTAEVSPGTFEWKPVL